MVFACASYAKIVVLLQCPEPGSLDGPYYTPTWADFWFTWGSFGAQNSAKMVPKSIKIHTGTFERNCRCHSMKCTLLAGLSKKKRYHTDCVFFSKVLLLVYRMAKPMGASDHVLEAQSGPQKGCYRAPFGVPFGRLWSTFKIKLPFWSLFVPPGTLWGGFGALLDTFWLISAIGESDTAFFCVLAWLPIMGLLATTSYYSTLSKRTVVVCAF